MSGGLDDLIAHFVRASSSGEEFWSLLSGSVRRLIPFDGACWFGLDPSTLLPNYPVRVENVGEGHYQSYWERESRVSDVLMLRDLARSPVPAGTLRAATGDRPHRSPRYRECLAPRNYDDELRAAFRIGGNTWGAVDLYRQRGKDPFSEKDVALIARAGTAIAGALRKLAVQERSEQVSTAPEGTGTALFDHAGRLISRDDQADLWFTEIGGPRWAQRPPSMSPVWAVVFRAANVHAGRDWGPSVVRLRTKHQHWVTLSASVHCTAGDPANAGPVAVSVSRSVGSDIAPLLAEAYGLTPREQQICQAATRGLSNQDIAANLYLSAHTVRDHLKAIFAKMAITSRGELAARLCSDIYEPTILAPAASAVYA